MFGFLDTAYAIAFAILLAAAGATLVPGMGTAVTLVGAGWGQWAAIGACIGCGVGALTIIGGGPAAITAASFVPGGALVVAGCIASCGAAIQ
jgi:hypothetical protein